MKSKSILVVLIVAIGTFMSSLDSSAVNLVMPLVEKDFRISISMVEWIATAYLLVISSLLLTFGRLSDLYGHKKVYTIGFIVFTVGSLLCALSVNIVMLIVFRIIQAIGAGMLFATGTAIITGNVTPENRGKALGITAMAVALGLCLGPVIGGFLATAFGWQSIFIINVPIGVIGTVLAFVKIPKDEEKKAVPFDIIGSLLIFVALLLILLPLNLSGDYHFPLVIFIIAITFGLLLTGFFLLYENKCSHPMLNTKLFRNKVFTAGNIAALFMYMAEFVMVFLAPFYLENLRGFSTIQTGMLYLPMPLATMLIAPISGAISDRFDSRYISSAGTTIMAAGLLLMSYLTKATPVAYIAVAMIVVGLGFGMFQTPNNSAIMGNAPKDFRGVASGTLATMRNTGMVTGIALSGALFSLFQKHAVQDYTRAGKAVGLVKELAFVNGLQLTFRTAVFIALFATIMSMMKGKAKSC